MKQSQLFTKTRKEAPKDEISKNAELLVRAGYVHKNMAGVYEFLPLGVRVMNKISNIVREEMDAIGGQEIKMTVLQDPEPWKASGRWSDDVVDNWFKTKLKSDAEIGLSFTHEEPLTKIMKEYISSYRDLPSYPYQIQVKFRNELRAKSGIMRGREFLMKDMYSFSKNKKEHDDFYEKAKKAYKNVFDRVGIGHLTYETFASGGSFSKYSHEFQTITPVGEDKIYLNEEKNIAINKEVLNDDVLKDLGFDRDDLVEKDATEVGNIFSLGTKFSDAIGLKFKDEAGDEVPVFMGSYGIGIGRLMGTVVELLSDDNGIIWPENISPFRVHLVMIGGEDKVIVKANKIYEDLKEAGIDVLFDDRDAQAGEKLRDSDLIGITNRIVVSERSLDQGGVEFKKRSDDKGEIIPEKDIIKLFKHA